MIRRLALVALLGSATLAASSDGGCGGEGKPRLYEACTVEQPCAEDLFCLDGSCSKACSVAGTGLAQGQCVRADDFCNDVGVGCCLLTIAWSNGGKGNCTVHLPAP